MKHKFAFLTITLIFISLTVTACIGAKSVGSGPCGENICLEIELETPISLNQPTDVTITIDTEVNMNDLRVKLDTDDPDAMLAQNAWVVDAPANQPVTIVTTVTFVQEKYYQLIAGASIGTDSASKGIRVHVTQAGGTLNPPDPHTPGVPAQGDSQTYPAYDPMPIPPQPTAWDRSLPALPPVQVMSNCGWSSQGVVTTWTEAKVSVDIPEAVTLNQEVPVTIHFEMPEGQPQSGAVSIKFCPPTPSAFQITGISQWSATLSPGGVFTANTKVRFTQTGVQSIPVGAYSAGTNQVVNGGQQVQVNATPLAVSNGWIKVLFEGFENRWPGKDWVVVDNSADGRDRYWDDDNLRDNGGNWAAWPANGGQHGIPAPTGTSTYFSNMDTRMIYGPFKLIDAELAHVSFDLWYRTENKDDFLALEISSDGVNFTELQNWSGLQSTWTNHQIDLSNYAGTFSSIWLAWRFVSDGDANVYDGPWVDNLEIWKYVAGTVTVSGKIEYYNKTNQITWSPYTTCYFMG